MRLFVGQLPPKSRVETQIRLHLKLADPHSGKMIPHYKYLILDDSMVVPSARRRPKDEKPEDDVETAMQSTYLRLQCRVITSQDVNSDVHRCVACVMRERRMQARRTKGEVPVDESEESMEQDKKKILVFHTPKVIDFSSGEATLPVRITCYCRHHQEQHGFGLVASLIDGYTGETLGSTMVGYIMITDDHKSQQRRPAKKQKIREDPQSAAPSSPPSSTRPFLSVAIPQQEYDDDSSSVSGSTSPMPYNTPAFPTFGSMQAYSAEASPATPPPPNPFPNMLDQSQPFRMGAPYDATSNPTAAGQLQPPTYAYYGGSLLSSPDSRSASGSPPLSPSMVSRPTVEKVIPHEGPLSGGLEITVLGQGLLPSHRCFFGANMAKISTYWGPTTVVCILPPASVPATVPVFILPPARYPGSPVHADAEVPGDTNAAFTYKDDSDKQLLELALQLIGMKMTGRIEDARDIAREIVRQSSNPSSPQENRSNFSSPGSSQYTKSASGSSKEELVLKALGALLTQQLSTSTPDQPLGLFDLSLQNSNGQTLMHLAILKGYSSLFQLLVRVATGKVDGFLFDVNIPDWNGWTPLHLAASLGKSDVVETLLTECGALAIMNDEVGLLPYEVVDAEKHPELHARLQKAAKRYENDLATAEQLRQASSALSPSTEDHIVSLPSPHSVLADPDDDIEAAKVANAAAALASSSTLEIFAGNNYKLRNTFLTTSVLQFMDSINGFWMSYRMAIYISTLVVLISLALLEVLPYNFRAGAVSVGFELTGINSGFNPNKTKPADTYAGSLSETRLWNFYFLARLIAVCGILFAILWHNRERLSRRSPLAFALGVLLILIIFAMGTLYIFDYLPFL
jgi:hypothetical protein